MCKFYYDYVKNKYGNNSRLLFTENDSLMYEIKTEDGYEDFTRDEVIFHFSNFIQVSQNAMIIQTLVIGKMKDQTAGVAIKEFDGLKP